MAESPSRERTVWFYRDNQRMNGANLKHSHYLEHVQWTPGFSPKITFGGKPLNEALIKDRPPWPHAALYGVAAPDVELQPRWNGAPTQAFLVCRLDAAGRRVLTLQRWGLVPSWARDRSIGNRLINARSETVHEKPAFRTAFRRRRCLVPANGWFEWRRTPAGKEPIWIRLADGRPLSLAGLWEAWGEGESRMESFTLLTCPAGEALAGVHARQPVVVAPEGYGAWLAAETPAERVQAPHAGPFEVRRVSALANSPRNNVPDVVRPVVG